VTTVYQSFFEGKLGANATDFLFTPGNELYIWDDGLGGTVLHGTGQILDTNWHHIVLAVDTDQAGPNNFLIYLDGALYNPFFVVDIRASVPAGYLTSVNSTGIHNIGGNSYDEHLYGRLSDFYLIDGQQL